MSRTLCDRGARRTPPVMVAPGRAMSDATRSRRPALSGSRGELGPSNMIFRFIEGYPEIHPGARTEQREAPSPSYGSATAFPEDRHACR